VAVNFFDRGNQIPLRKPPTFHKSPTNLIIKNYVIISFFVTYLYSTTPEDNIVLYDLAIPHHREPPPI
jgi:hypothetical protein